MDIRSRRIRIKIHYSSTSAGNVDWVGDQIRYKKIELSMDQLRGMVHGLTARTYGALEAVLVLKEADFPRIPWLALRDDPTREGIDHNFTQHERNPSPVDASTWLIDHLIDERFLHHRGVPMDSYKNGVNWSTGSTDCWPRWCNGSGARTRAVPSS